MVMNWHDAALAVAGLIGCGVAVFHGVLTQRLVVEPFRAMASTARTPAAVRRLVPGLLHFSTYNWFLGGLALLVAAVWFGWEARLATGILVGSSYLFGAAGNLWGTRRLHPGWVLYTLAVILIAYGVAAPGD
jgi:hypothetical protein